jgi:hypothetical protein
MNKVEKALLCPMYSRLSSFFSSSSPNSQGIESGQESFRNILILSSAQIDLSAIKLFLVRFRHLHLSLRTCAKQTEERFDMLIVLSLQLCRRFAQARKQLRYACFLYQKEVPEETRILGTWIE